MKLRVYRRHLYHDRPEQAYCARGAREFFQKHGLDWGAFLRNGIEPEVIERIDDAMAMRALQHAREELIGGQ